MAGMAVSVEKTSTWGRGFWELPKYSVEDVLEIVEESEKEREEGKLISYKKAIADVKKKYGL